MTQKEIDTMLLYLERAPELVVPLVKDVPQERLKERPSSGQWSAHEHACHLATVDRVMEVRLDQMLKERHPGINSYDPGRHDDPDELLMMDLDHSLTQYVEGRRKLIDRLKKLTPDQWGRTADHVEYNAYSIYIMFRHLAMHDLFHAYRIEEILLS